MQNISTLEKQTLQKQEFTLQLKEPVFEKYEKKLYTPERLLIWFTGEDPQVIVHGKTTQKTHCTPFAEANELLNEENALAMVPFFAR